jgi:hypothetical protein
MVHQATKKRYKNVQEAYRKCAILSDDWMKNGLERGQAISMVNHESGMSQRGSNF